MPRRVAREEAERLIHAVRPGVAVQQVRVGGGADASLLDREHETPLDTFEYEFSDGGVYVWQWASPESIRSGTQLWCSRPGPDAEILCVRADTVLPEPEVLRTRQGSVRLVRSRFSVAQPTVVDATVVAPADLTLGTGITEDDALLVLRGRHGRMIRQAQAATAGGAFVTAPLINLAGQSFQLGTAVGVGAVALALSPALAMAGWNRFGPGARRRRRFSETYSEGYLQPVEVKDWRKVGVTVVTNEGAVWRWAVRPELGHGFRTGQRVWATPLREGSLVNLVGLRDGDGLPDVVEGDSAAAPEGPPRSKIQDVVRTHL